jgi:hypothetical protein
MTMATIPSTLERLNYGSPAGCIATGQHRQVIDGSGATRTLTAEESGALVLMDKADGIVFTLPAPAVGLQFEFLASVAVSSNVYKVITSAATVFLKGGVIMGDVTVATSGDYFEADGATHVAISENGTTKGGLLGDRFTVTCVSSTLWVIHGVLHGAGTLDDPFTTS